MSVRTFSQTLCRLLLALSFLVFSLDCLGLINGYRSIGIRGLHDVEWMGVTVLCALIQFAAVWLMFGLRSRVVALLGLVLMIGLLLWFEALGVQTSYGSLQVVASAVLALPLFFLGGGRFALYRRGWADIV
ncbi:hypothetical protein [Nioella nitratireducens]|uniref:hypothetical protein n=1 Tax=Nioella nitratireducens TaxID=1287720 RepID=UPI0008FD8DB9|nr:hypothetical protein [Nioella nitratireducens]